jgi:hypothetical protein
VPASGFRPSLRRPSIKGVTRIRAAWRGVAHWRRSRAARQRARGGAAVAGRFLRAATWPSRGGGLHG